MSFTAETLRKVAAFRNKLAGTAISKSLLAMRVENYRRSIELDMTSYKLKTIPGSRGEAVAQGKVPTTIVPNRKASKKLDARRRDFDYMTNGAQLSMTRPGSLQN